jgi:hypothetical protein
MAKTIQLIEDCTGAHLFLICHYLDSKDGSQIHIEGKEDHERVFGKLQTPLMQAVYADPRACAARKQILSEYREREKATMKESVDKTVDAANLSKVVHPPAVPNTKPDIEAVRSQLRSALGTRPGFGKKPKPTWWPCQVRWASDYRSAPELKLSDPLSYGTSIVFRPIFSHFKTWRVCIICTA